MIIPPLEFVIIPTQHFPLPIPLITGVYHIQESGLFISQTGCTIVFSYSPNCCQSHDSIRARTIYIGVKYAVSKPKDVRQHETSLFDIRCKINYFSFILEEISKHAPKS